MHHYEMIKAKSFLSNLQYLSKEISASKTLKQQMKIIKNLFKI